MRSSVFTLVLCAIAGGCGSSPHPAGSFTLRDEIGNSALLTPTHYKEGRRENTLLFDPSGQSWLLFDNQTLLVIGPTEVRRIGIRDVPKVYLPRAVPDDFPLNASCIGIRQALDAFLHGGPALRTLLRANDYFEVESREGDLGNEGHRHCRFVGFVQGIGDVTGQVSLLEPARVLTTQPSQCTGIDAATKTTSR